MAGKELHLEGIRGVFKGLLHLPGAKLAEVAAAARAAAVRLGRGQLYEIGAAAAEGGPEAVDLLQRLLLAARHCWLLPG